MKRIINNSKLLSIALMVFLSVASAESFASNKSENPVDFKYVGNTNNQPVFQLNLNNNESEEFVVTLRDLYGRILYTEKVEGVQISRKYRLDTNEIEGGQIKVEINSKKSKTKAAYSITTTSHIVDDVTINKL